MEFRAACPECKTLIPPEIKDKYFLQDMKEKDAKVEHICKLNEDPTIQWCPVKRCRRYVNVGDCQGNQPEAAVCQDGHKFCIL